MTDITIIMPSYNKEKYIAEALDSVFMQETNYNYHIVVADDCSTDKTIEIVKQYQEKFSNKITLLTSDKNLKLYKNILRAYEITKTDYFCVLDPDDYWIDKYKIQKALDFLEKNKDFTIYVTDTNILTKNGEIKPFINRRKIKDSNFKDFLNNKAKFGCTLGSVFRNVVFKNGIPQKMITLPSETAEQSFRGDTFRTAIHMHEGKVHCVPEVDAIYRITDEGLWQGSSELQQNILNANIFKDLWLYFDKKYDELLINSYKTANKTNADLINQLLRITDLKKRNIIIEKLISLKLFYNKYNELIKVKINKSTKLEYKVMLYFYKKLYKKLSKKGLV